MVADMKSGKTVEIVQISCFQGESNVSCLILMLDDHFGVKYSSFFRSRKKRREKEGTTT